MLSLWLLLALLVFYVVARNWKRLYKFYVLHERAVVLLKDIPGPPAIPIFGSAHLFKWDNEEFTYQIEAWGREYIGGCQPRTGLLMVWVGPVPIVFLATCKAVKPVLESNSLITKPAQYDSIRKWIGEGLLTSTGDKWHSRRKMLTPTFHFNVLQGFYDIFLNQANILADLVGKYSDTDEAFNMFPYIKRCALDVICETAMGTRINSQTGKNSEYVQAVVRLSQLVWDHERFPWLWVKPIWYGTGMGFEFDRHVKLANDFTRNVIAKRRKVLEEKGLLDQLRGMSPEEMKKHKLSFLDLLIGIQSTQNLSDEDIREEVDTFMFEGHDTTASGIGFTLWWLGQELDCQRKVHAELDAVFGRSDRPTTPEDLKQLPYLEKCIKESLRLTPSVPLIARKLSHDVEIANFTIPEGCTVVVSPLACSRDDEQFEHPDAFYPEHFDASAMAARDPYSYIPFSAGPRNCIGQKFALNEEKSVLATVLRRYRFVTVHPFPENRFLPELILKPSQGFHFKIYKRKVEN